MDPNQPQQPQDTPQGPVQSDTPDSLSDSLQQPSTSTPAGVLGQESSPPNDTTVAFGDDPARNASVPSGFEPSQPPTDTGANPGFGVGQPPAMDVVQPPQASVPPETSEAPVAPATPPQDPLASTAPGASPQVPPVAPSIPVSSQGKQSKAGVMIVITIMVAAVLGLIAVAVLMFL